MMALAESPVDVSEWRFDPPAEVLESRIFANSGYFVVSGLFDESTLAALRAEAEVARAAAARQYVAESDGAEGRGGMPGRAFGSGLGGELHWGLHGSEQMAKALSGLCGASISATGSGNYSYYDQPGDFLALHRDVLECDVTVITALTPDSRDEAAGELTVYPGFLREPLSVVRAAGRGYGTRVALDRGHTVVLLGGMVPHEVTPTCAGQERIVAVNCYRIGTA